jgi:hypothetical protein
LPAVNRDSQESESQTKYEIELLLDWDNPKISDFNQQTKHTREINVDITVYTFP